MKRPITAAINKVEDFVKVFIFLFIGGGWLYLFFKGILIPFRTKDLPGRAVLIKETSIILFLISLLTIVELFDPTGEQKKHSVIVGLWLKWSWASAFAYYLFTLNNWLEQIKWKGRDHEAEKSALIGYERNKRLTNFSIFLLMVFGSLFPLKFTILLGYGMIPSGFWGKTITNIPTSVSIGIPVIVFFVTEFLLMHKN